MTEYTYDFEYLEDDKNPARGYLELNKPLPYQCHTGGSGSFRLGKIVVDSCAELDLAIYHSQATSAFIYLSERAIDQNLLDLIGIPAPSMRGLDSLLLPGQLCLGAARTQLINQAITDIFSAPTMTPSITSRRQQNLAVFPIAREGLKYGVADALLENFGYYCDEVILDAHHVFDSSVPIYNRKVEMTLFKDKDLDQHQRENISVAFIADSIASGLVMKEVIERIKDRFDHIEQIEVIAPLATIRGLSRIARSVCSNGTHVRVHVFETLLNALAPDFYYSAHINDPALHIRPDLEADYRRWWGQDRQGLWIADTACAGYGWSEVFYSPRKQIDMINSELKQRHGITIGDVVRRNLR